MRTAPRPEANPFALMLSPQRVKQAIRRSEALRQLQQRAYYLMDKPQPNADAELAAFDAALDAASPWQHAAPQPRAEAELR